VEEEEGGRKEDVRLGDRGTRLEPDKGFIDGAREERGGKGGERVGVRISEFKVEVVVLFSVGLWIAFLSN